MAINQDIVDRYVEYRAWLIRYEDRVVRDVLKTLERGEEQAIGAIANAYDDLLNSSDNLVAWDGRGVATRRKALKRVRAALADVFPQARKSLRGALENVATDAEDEFIATLEETLPQPALDELELSRVPERQLANILDNQFGERLTGSAADALRQIEGDALARVNRVLTDGIRDGVGTRQMVSRARKAVGVKRGSAMYHDVARHVRTAVQTTANDVAGQIHRENSDIVRREQFVATLDSDTCPECGPLDGTTYRFDGKGTGKIRRPPLHPNCRCFVAPVLHDWKAMGLPDSLPAQSKRLLDGKPAPRTTWGEWVQRNPQRLERALGPGRAELIRQGRVDLKDLYSRQTDEIVPLRRLRQEAAA